MLDFDKEYVTFDDVLLIPGKSLESRNSASVAQLLDTRSIAHPIIPANMDTISGKDLCDAQLKSGGIAILHRYLTVQDRKNIWWDLNNKHHGIFYISIGISDEEKDIVEQLVKFGCYRFCIDVANAYSDKILEMIAHINRICANPLIIVGNIATVDAAKFLLQNYPKIEMLKVGIGPGSLCTTRLITGCGFPQLSAIYNVSKYLTCYYDKVKLIADGGIKNSGDIVKAIVAGADYIMTGSLFAGCEETPGDIIIIDGKKYKKYAGMASKDAQIGWREVSDSQLNKIIVPEGEATLKPIKGPYSEVLYQLLGGLKSGMSYLNCQTLDKLKWGAEFIKVSQNTVMENRPHGL